MHDDATAALHRWIASADPTTLEAGPTIDDLGGVETVANASTALASSPLFLYLVDAAGQAEGVALREARIADLDAAVIQGFATHSRPSSYASATARLLQYPALVARTSTTLDRVLVARAEGGYAGTSSPRASAVGVSALEALVHLASTGLVRPHRLLAFCADLAGLVTTAPVEAVRRLPRLVGLLHEHVPDDDLVNLLHALAEIPVAQADALFELALADLRSALNAENQQDVTSGLLAARRGMGRATALDADRLDARAYAAALDAVFALLRHDGDEVRAATRRLDDAVSHYWAWLDGCYVPPWTQPRREAERSWSRLCAFLVPAARSLGENVWYHNDLALLALVRAYEQTRALTLPGVHQDRVARLTRPVIEATFIENAHKLAVLDRALAEDPRFQNDPTARELRDSVQAAHAGVRVAEHPLPGGDAPGKDLRRVPAILKRLGLTNTVRLVDAVPIDLRDLLEEALYDDEVRMMEIRNPKLENLLDRLTSELRESPDWPLAGKEFSTLVEETVLYLTKCYDVGKKMAGGRAFLFEDKKPTAKEKDLQLDFIDWLERPFEGHVRAELEDVGTGRADIAILLPRFTFYIECKREESDSSRETLRKYLGQSRAYTVANVAFVVLIVLDLTRHATGAPDLFSSVWIDRVQVDHIETPRYVLVARVPGNRPRPSATSTPI